MSFSFFGSTSPNNVRGQVVAVLGENWPLSLKEIHNKLARQFDSVHSYQATHKVVVELLKEGVLLKQGKGYLLNELKIAETKKAIEELENRIKTVKAVDDKQAEIFFFNSFKEWGNKTLQLLFEKTNYSLEEKWHIYQDFSVSLFTMSKEEYDWFTKGASKGGYIIYNGQTLLDKLIMGLWEKTGFKTKNVKSYFHPYTFFVYNDLVYQTIFPEELKKKFEKIYKKTKSIEEINTDEYYQAYYGPATIQLTIIKNKELADKLRNEVKSFFED